MFQDEFQLVGLEKKSQLEKKRKNKYDLGESLMNSIIFDVPLKYSNGHLNRNGGATHVDSNKIILYIFYLCKHSI